ncbi:hypothetical protein AB0D27_41405 [Streptomyces sp. NPDC048415]|uniref:hypothetical protein n=1 Tax=Streptomyces sp. NPDC048415 TaxID=3154822 RepID=UPI00343DE28E
MPHLTYAIDDGLATLVLNNPQQNRTDSPTATELAETLEKLAAAAPVLSSCTPKAPNFS